MLFETGESSLLLPTLFWPAMRLFFPRGDLFLPILFSQQNPSFFCCSRTDFLLCSEFLSCGPFSFFACGAAPPSFFSGAVFIRGRPFWAPRFLLRINTVVSPLPTSSEPSFRLDREHSFPGSISLSAAYLPSFLRSGASLFPFAGVFKIRFSPS